MNVSLVGLGAIMWDASAVFQHRFALCTWEHLHPFSPGEFSVPVCSPRNSLKLWLSVAKGNCHLKYEMIIRAKGRILLPSQGSSWDFEISWFCAGPSQTIWEGNKKPQQQKFTMQEQSVLLCPGLGCEPNLHTTGECPDSRVQRQRALSLPWWSSFPLGKSWNNHWSKGPTQGFLHTRWEAYPRG